LGVKTFWIMVRLGLSFKKSGLDLDCKIWHSTDLWHRHGRIIWFVFTASYCSTLPWSAITYKS